MTYAVGVVAVRRQSREAHGEEGHEVAHEVRQRVARVRDHRRRAARQAAEELEERQQQVDRHPRPRHAVRRSHRLIRRFMGSFIRRFMGSFIHRFIHGFMGSIHSWIHIWMVHPLIDGWIYM